MILFEVIEELLGIDSMHATTKGSGLFQTPIVYVKQKDASTTPSTVADSQILTHRQRTGICQINFCV